jgi:uridine kinase
MPVVIGIAGPPGSGKSTLAAGLAGLLGDTVVIDMDHYQRFTDQPLEALAAWAARGADPNEFEMPLLAAHLLALQRGEAIVDPTTGLTRPPRHQIVFETHFGRAHRATGAVIDHLLWLDVPPDIALARNLRAFVRPLMDPAWPPLRRAEALAWIDGYLEQYLGGVAPLLHLQAARVRPDADLLVAACETAAEVAARLCRCGLPCHRLPARGEMG